MATFDTVLFEQAPLVGILRNYPSQIIKELVPHYFDAGFRTLEVTLNASDSLDSIRLLTNEYGGMNIGAGTVCTIEELKSAKDAGAAFIVSPICDVKLIKAAKELDLAVFPGALTPTEIYAAWKAGATAVKLFPASSFGLNYLRELRGPLPDIKIIPVGGIYLNNMQHYFEQGAYGVGLGGGLFRRKDIVNEDFEKIDLHFHKLFKQLINQSKTRS